MNVGTLGSIINLTICFAIPLMLVALGGMYSERSGVINLALEGIMIIGALASTLFLQALDAAGWGESVFTSQLGVVLAALIAGIAGLVFSLLLAFAAINLRADQTIGGTALNIFAPPSAWWWPGPCRARVSRTLPFPPGPVGRQSSYTSWAP